MEITETTLKISVQHVVLLSGDWEFKVRQRVFVSGFGGVVVDG